MKICRIIQLPVILGFASFAAVFSHKVVEGSEQKLRRGNENTAANAARERILPRAPKRNTVKNPPKPKPSAPQVSLDCCKLAPGERQRKLLAIYSTVSNKADILTVGTPQNKAFNWILTNDAYCVCPEMGGCEPVQRYVMAVYYYSTNGENWANCGASSATCNADGTLFNGKVTSACYSGADAPWLSKYPSCKWCGNNCDDTLNLDCITQINLDNINQAGTIPKELKNATYLYYFSNKDGALSSTIPPELGNLKNLSFFNVNFNQVKGSIPSTFYSLSNLNRLALNDNKLTGSISSGICNLVKLSFVQLGNDESGSNNFSGSTIPSCIGALPSLGVFDVSGLELVGSLPSFTSPSLFFLDVGNNRLLGNLDGTNWSNLKNLDVLVLSGNPIVGTIPSSIGGIKPLTLADFTNMGLSGSMPAEICANRNTNGGKLEFLQADCNGATPQVSCTCCTFCQ